MGKILNGGLIGLVILLVGVKYLYTGAVDGDLIFTLVMTVLPILTGITVGYNLFCIKSRDSLPGVVKLFVVGICIMISIGAGVFYLWTFEDTITEHNTKSYSIVEDIIIEVDTIDSIRSDKSEVSIYITNNDKKKMVESFVTRNNLDLKVEKVNTIDEYSLYLAKYSYCYDFKDSKYRLATFPIIVDKNNKLVGFNNDDKFINGLSGILEENSLGYLNDEELAKEIYMHEVVDFTDKEFFGIACSNLFSDESTKQIVLDNIELKMKEGKILEEDLTLYNSSIFSYEIQKYYGVDY
ncbi:MAG: hypothetical protein ACRC6T_10650 [Sarcina sp.]